MPYSQDYMLQRVEDGQFLVILNAETLEPRTMPSTQ